jgi:hypothetical protein
MKKKYLSKNAIFILYYIIQTTNSMSEFGDLPDHIIRYIANSVEHSSIANTTASLGMVNKRFREIFSSDLTDAFHNLINMETQIIQSRLRPKRTLSDLLQKNVDDKRRQNVANCLVSLKELEFWPKKTTTINEWIDYMVKGNIGDILDYGSISVWIIIDTLDQDLVMLVLKNIILVTNPYYIMITCKLSKYQNTLTDAHLKTLYGIKHVRIPCHKSITDVGLVHLSQAHSLWIVGCASIHGTNLSYLIYNGKCLYMINCALGWTSAFPLSNQVYKWLRKSNRFGTILVK